MRVVIVGGGMAGTRLASELAARDPAGRLSVTVLGAEDVPGYNRVLLCDVLSDRLSTSDLVLPAPAGATVRLGTEVVSIDRASRRVQTAGGAVVRYDVLVLATGGAPELPPLPGLHTRSGALSNRVHPLRTAADYRRLTAALPSASRVVVVGGGPLGVETAVALADRGLAVTIVHKHARLLPTFVDAEGSQMVRRRLRSRGVVTNVAAAATRLRTGRRGVVTAVEMDGGRSVDADLVLLACGTRPRVELARGAGLRLAVGTPGRPGGVMVDDGLRTADPRIFAIGDCAAHPAGFPGHVAPAWEQATVVADRLSGRDPHASYRGTSRVFRLRGWPGVAAVGTPEARAGDRVIQLADGTRAAYQKLIVREDLVAGLVAVGRHDSVPTLVDWYEHATPVPSSPVELAESLQARPGLKEGSA